MCKTKRSSDAVSAKPTLASKLSTNASLVAAGAKAPKIVRVHAKSDFLDNLDRLNEQDQEFDRIDKEKRQKKKEEKLRQQKYRDDGSASGLQASNSDETASQTYIGKGPESCAEPGQISLDLIKAESQD